jgi:hypothetical protein
VVAALVLLARFHKWYYWLFPLLALQGLDRCLTRPSRSRALAAGLVAGIASLYRVDLGLACLCAHWIAWTLIGRGEGRPAHPHALAYLAGLLVPPGVWLAVLVGYGGWSAISDYASATVDGAVSVVARRSLPFPRFELEDPHGATSGAALGYLLVPVAYATAVGLGWRGLRRVPGTIRSRALLASAVFGLCVLPQGLHRSDAQHLLQVLPPALIVGALLAADVAARWRARRRAAPERVLAFGVAAVVAVAGIGLSRSGGIDMVGAALPIAWKYRDLARTVRPTDGEVGALLGTLHAETAPDDRILVVASRWQLYFFADRAMSGYVPAYALGHLDTPAWRRRNLDAVRRHPPRAVVASGDLASGADAEFRAAQPELWRWLAERYTTVAGRAAGSVVLTRDGSAAATR